MNLLSIGGSDPSTGAGIQSDIKAFSSFNTHSITVITAITGQNTSEFGMVEPVSQKILKNQLDSVMSDFRIDGIKIGMVYNSQIIKTLHHHLKKLNVPTVIDPVIKSTTGGMLIERKAIEDFKKFLIPLATVITPNKFEAEMLSKVSNKKKTIKEISKIIQKMGATNVVITGIEAKKNKISDFILEKDKQYFITGDKIFKKNHGSGCNYSAAMTFALANRKSIRESAKFAKQFAGDSIKNAQTVGKGIPITYIQEKDKTNLELSNAINKFVKIRDIYKNIPECQTNFVYSREKPKSTQDILGIAGRIVKSGKEITVAGNLAYGGSKHVATGLLALNKKFPHIRSAINLRYQNSTISKIKKSNLMVYKYDRRQEPKNVKSKGSTVKWGIGKAIKNATETPDIIYHEGDFGKEPMIIVFGENPNIVLSKILKII